MTMRTMFYLFWGGDFQTTPDANEHGQISLTCPRVRVGLL